MAPPPQYLQGAAISSSGAGPITVTFANNVVSGSKIICFTTTTSVTATPDNPTTGSGAFTFTAVGAASTGSPNGALAQQMFFLDTPASLVGTKPTISVSYNASAQVGLSIIEVSGLLAGNTTACLDVAQVTKLITGAASEAQPAYTSHISGEFFVVGYGDNGGPAIWTVPAGYSADNSGGTGTVGAGINDSSTCNNGIAYKISTGGAEGTPNWTFTGTPTAMGSGFIAVAFQIAWSSPTQSVIIPPGQQFAPLARQFGPVPPFALLQAEGQAPAAVAAAPGYGALRSPVAQGASTDVGPNSSSSRNGATLPVRGRVTGISSGVYDQVGPPFKSDSSPVAQGSTSSASSSRNGAQLATRGRTAGIQHSGVYDQTGPPVYPLRSPVATGTSTSPSSHNAATLPVRGRVRSSAGVYNQVGAPVYPLHSAVATGGTSAAVSRNGAALPPRGRVARNAGVFNQTGPAVTPQQRAVRAKVTPLPPFGRTATMVPLVTTSTPVVTPATFYPLNHPVQSRIPRPTWRGTCRTMSVLVVTIPPVTSGPPFTPQGLVAGRVRGFPIRGRSQTRTGTFQQTGPFVEPLHQPAGTRVIGVRTGGTQSFTQAQQPVGPPVTPLQRPVTAKVRVLPPRGTSYGRAGTFEGTGTAFYALNHPVQAHIPPQPPFGRTATMTPLTYTVVTAVTPATFYPLNRPVSAVIRPLSTRGRTTSRIGLFQQIGPAVTPQQRALRARLPQQPFLKGRVSSNAGFRGQLGPAVTPLQRPVAARTRPLPPRGRAAGRAGTFSFVVQTGPPVYPLHSPVAAVIRPLPGRGRTAGRAGVFQGTGPAVKPLQHPVYAWRPGPRRGVSLTSVRPPAAAGTGSKFYPFRKPVTARQPLPPHGQRWTAPPYVPPFVPAGGHGYPYHAALTITRWSATLTSTEWEADMRNPVRYSAISTSARWPSSLEAGRWFATSGPA